MCWFEGCVSLAVPPRHDEALLRRCGMHTVIKAPVDENAGRLCKTRRNFILLAQESCGFVAVVAVLEVIGLSSYSDPTQAELREICGMAGSYAIVSHAPRTSLVSDPPVKASVVSWPLVTLVALPQVAKSLSALTAKDLLDFLGKANIATGPVSSIPGFVGKSAKVWKYRLDWSRFGLALSNGQPFSVWAYCRHDLPLI